MNKSTTQIPCQYFTFGCCKHDSAGGCAFSHDRSVCVPGSIMKPCIHFQKGPCRYGKFCLYQHERVQPPTAAIDAKVKHNTVADASKTMPAPSTVKLTPLNRKPHTSSDSPASSHTVFAEEPEEHEMTEAEFRQQLENGSVYYYGAHENDDGQSMHRSEPPKAPNYGRLVEQHGYDPNQVAYDHRPPCRFFAMGTCRFGTSCHYSHATSFAPTPESFAVSSEEAMAIESELAASQELECGVCMERVLENGKRFGILTECNHVFCLDCIRDWRQSEMSQFDRTKSNVRLCPQCRVESFMVIPSNRFVSDPARKLQLLSEYKTKLSQVPCLHFKQGAGSCPFGESCFYRHALPDGTPARAQVRMFTNEEGRLRGPADVKLGDILVERMQRGLNMNR